ncbi:hypothetical protein F5X97DRAFT_293092 [Nemania serpens]|nr:hypothetical protein F5X97DRAFT_293092 [Nemania serpens]
MAQQQLPQQPDFALISDTITELGQNFSDKCNVLGQQFALCENLAPVAAGNAILDSLAAINRNLEQLNNRMDRLEMCMGGLEMRMGRLEARMGGLETRMGGLEMRIDRGEANATARLWNGRPLIQDSVLEPLYSPITNERVHNFPQTKNELETLSVVQITELLRLLGQPVQGTRVQKLLRLKITCGITSMC